MYLQVIHTRFSGGRLRGVGVKVFHAFLVDDHSHEYFYTWRGVVRGGAVGLVSCREVFP